MSSIITSLKDLIGSMFEVIFSVIGGAFDAVSGLVTALIEFVVGTVKMALHAVGSTLEAAGGVGKFIASKSSNPNYLESRISNNSCEKAISLLSQLLPPVATATCSTRVVRDAPSRLEPKS